jgi:LacI family transcriptional regulator
VTSESAHPSQRDIARNLGINVSTVSLALRNNVRISAKLRAAVKAEAERVGYVPNALMGTLLTRLRTGRQAGFQGLLALVYLEENPKLFELYCDTTAWLRGANHRAHALGYVVEVTLGRDFGGDTGAMIARLRARGVDGVLMPHTAFPRVPMEGLARLWDAFPCVCFGCGKPYEVNSHYASNDDYATTYEATAHAHRAGRKRIALAMHWRNDATTENRQSGGYFSYCLNHRLEPLPVFDFHTFEPSVFYEWFAKARPDCIISGGPLVRDLLIRLGRKIPEEVSLVSVTVENTPQWAGIMQHSEEVGEAAVDLLVGQVQRGERGVAKRPREVLIRGTWVRGETLIEEEEGGRIISPKRAKTKPSAQS